MQRPSLPLACALLAVLLGGCSTDPNDDDKGDAGTDPKIASIAVTSPAVTIAVGETVQLVAVARNDKNADLAHQTFTWSSSDNALLTVDSKGRATGMAAGSATITATAGGRSGSVAMTVKAGAIHSGSVEADQVWRKADGPHIVQGIIYVGGPSAPVLRIEAGTEVRFAAGTYLAIGEGMAGALRIEGTEAEPVRLTALSLNPQRGHWAGVHFGSSASAGSTLSHVTLEYCGGAVDREEACIFVRHAEIEIAMQTVTVRQSSTGGVAMNSARFRAGSQNVSVHDSAGPAIAIEAPGAGTLPAGGSFTNNTRNVIEISYPTIERSMTLANHGIPYVFMEETTVGGSSNPTLTIAAGTELRFKSNVSFNVGYGAAGNLRAIGTAESPIVFTADSESPAPGFWRGIFLGEHSSGITTKLQHVVVSYGGIDTAEPGANIRVHNEKGAVVTDSRLEFSGNCGIAREEYNGVAFTTDFTAPALNNTFANNVGANQCGP